MTWRLGLIVVLAAAIAVAAAGCGEEPAGSPSPVAAVVQPAEAATPSRPADEPAATVTPTVADTPLPTQAAATPVTTVAADATPTAAAGGVRPLPRPVVPGVDLHDSQVVTAPGRMRSTMAPWRDGGGNRFFSTHVFGTPFMLNEKGELLPWIATAITSNEDFTVWTMKLREDAVFQDGTPITAADFKAYWEHGAKPENIVAWGGASLTLGEIKGWEELRAGDVAEAVGLRVVDEHTLEIEIESPNAAWPLYMAAWHIGLSKLEQMKSDENWGNSPIGAGPFSLTYDPETGLTELTRVDLVGRHWTGLNDTPIIEKLVLPNIEEEQIRMVMFENEELDVMSIDIDIYEAALDPNHRLNPLLYESPYGGLFFIDMREYWPPLEDLLVRKALAHGQNMEEIVSTVWGPTATHARGMISRLIPCHNPEADHQPYDPDLARQALRTSSYGSTDNLPQLKIDLSRPEMVEMGVAMKEYWKDNLDIDLDILKRESGTPRREGSQFYRISLGSWIPDPSQIVSGLLRRFDDDYYRSHDPVHGRTDSAVLASHPSALDSLPVLVALLEYALSLPLDHPDRCEAFQAVEKEYLYKAYMIPIREIDPVRWVVQPWLRGFKSTFNQDFNTLTTAYVVRH